MSGGQQQDVLAVFVSREVKNGFVHGGQDQVFPQGQTEQVGVGDLLGPVQPGGEGFRECQSVGDDRHVAVARMPRELVQDRRGLAHADLP